MIMKIKLSHGATMPTRSHIWDGGLDLYAAEDAFITDGFATIETGVHVQIPAGFVGFVKSRSGMMSKHGITTDGVIDCGYTGSIKVVLTDNSSCKMPYVVRKGDKIAQLVIIPCALPQLELVDELPETDRGDNGFGSTGT